MKVTEVAISFLIGSLIFPAPVLGGTVVKGTAQRGETSDNAVAEGPSAAKDLIDANSTPKKIPISKHHPDWQRIDKCLASAECQSFVCHDFDGLCQSNGSSCTQLQAFPWFSCSCPDGLEIGADPTLCEKAKPGKKRTDPKPSKKVSTNPRNSNDGCPGDFSCPDDTRCIVKEDGTPQCICPASGRIAFGGVLCSVLENFEPVDIGSLDDGCDPEAAGCGEGAECVLHFGEVVCECPAIGSVPRGEACPMDDQKTEEEEGGDQQNGSHVCTDWNGWKDSYGDGCDWYEEKDKIGCPTYGDSYEPFDSAGYGLGTADDACCHCLGGKSCRDMPGWKDSFGSGCDWYEENDEPGCPHYGLSYEGVMGTPKDGCCHCAGGILNVVEESPTNGAGRSLGTAAEDGEPFTIIFISDMENEYRGHLHRQCEKIAEYVKNFAERNVAFDNHPEYKIDPKLVIHGGDLSDAKWGWKFSADDLFAKTYQQFYDAGIPFISVLGNHDEGHGMHEKADDFVRKSFQKAADLTNDFTYEEIPRDSVSINSYYVAKFRGLQIGTVNHHFEGAGSQWETFKSKLDHRKQALFFSHVPLWYPDHADRQEYAHFMKTFPNPHHYGGHAHVYRKPTLYEGVTTHRAPYPHPWEDLEPGFLALLVSPTQGLLETKRISYDYDSVAGCPYRVVLPSFDFSKPHGDGNQKHVQLKFGFLDDCDLRTLPNGTICDAWNPDASNSCKYCKEPASYWYGYTDSGPSGPRVCTAIDSLRWVDHGTCKVQWQSSTFPLPNTPACGDREGAGNCWQALVPCEVGKTCHLCCHGHVVPDDQSILPMCKIAPKEEESSRRRRMLSALDSDAIEDIFHTCKHETYDLKVYVEGAHSHIDMIAIPTEATKTGCDKAIDFDDSIEGQRAVQFVDALRESYIEEDWESTSLLLGTFTLESIMAAADTARVVEGEWDAVTNNCATFALDMAHSLDVPITKDIKHYVVHTLVKNPSFVQRVRGSPHAMELAPNGMALEDLTDEQIMWHLVSIYVNRNADEHMPGTRA